jgi:nitrous oxidase accessory protein NosD
MFKLLAFAAAIGAVIYLCNPSAAPALASSSLTFVSGRGSDTGNCAAPANPCRTFQHAISQTSTGGEVKALDPADYGPVTITTSMTITGTDGASISTNGYGITVRAGPNDVVNLDRLNLEGKIIDLRTIGIVLYSAGSLTMRRCVVQGFGAGIVIEPSRLRLSGSDGARRGPSLGDVVPESTGAVNFVLEDTALLDNFGDGIDVESVNVAKGILNRVSMENNGANGLDLFCNSCDVTAVDSKANINGTGFRVEQRSILRLGHSAATRNRTGINVGAAATAVSLADNDFNGNTQDVIGTLTTLGNR